MPTADETNSGEVIAYIVRHLACDTCCAPYTPDSIQMALRDGIQATWIATCPTCQTERPVTVFDQPPYVRLRHVEPVVPHTITDSDVAEWQTFLRNFSGDMYALLADG